MAISLSTISSGYNVSAINDNFTTLLNFVNDSAVWRTGSTSGETTMVRDLDMNSYKIINYKTDVSDSTSLITVGVADSRYYNVSGDTLTGTMQVNGQQLIGAPTPTEASQVAIKSYVDNADNAIITKVDGNYLKTLRFPEEVPVAADKATRASSLLGFTSEGKPVPIFSMTDTADLAVKLAGENGTSYIGAPDGGTLKEYMDARPQEGLGERGKNWGTVAATVAGDGYSVKMEFDEAGRLKTNSYQDGVMTGSGTMFPVVNNTGRMISTTYGKFPEKFVYFPSDNYESEFTSPALGFTYNSAGLPKLSVISPARYRAGNDGWPSAGSATQNVLVSDLATTADIANQLSYARVALSTSQQYVQVARWLVSSVQYNTELKLNITSSNTTDNFLGSVVVEANIQSSGTTLATTSNITQTNLTKYVKARFDGPRERVPLNTATTATIPRLACTGDGTYLYLWLVIPAGQSSVTLSTIMQGTGSGITSYISSLSPTITAPSGLVYVPMQVDYNGTNSSVNNAGHVVAADAHIRICSTSGTSSRSDITRDGFIWGGYGTYKSFRESCTISRTSTGVYSVVGVHQSYDWQLSQPVDLNGEQAAIAKVTAVSSDGYTVQVSLYAIKYTYDSTTGAVTRGIGDLMDIPTSTWVDLKGSITF